LRSGFTVHMDHFSAVLVAGIPCVHVASRCEKYINLKTRLKAIFRLYVDFLNLGTAGCVRGMAISFC
jgi:hypothetical protein